VKIFRKTLKVAVLVVTVLSVVSLILAYTSTFISPAKTPEIAFFGLGYPVILAFNLLFLIFWIIKQSRWGWIILVSLLIGTPIHLRFFQFNFADNTEDSDATTLRVLSYNVELFGWYHWRSNIQRRNQMFDQIDRNRADIYCFQEFFYTNVPNRFDTRDSLTALLDAPHYHDHYTHEMYNVQFYGIATLSKYPIVDRGVIEFPNDKNNICIFSDLLVDDEIIRVYNGHLCSIRFSGDEHEFVGDLQSDPGLLERSKVARIYLRLKHAFQKRAWQAELIRNHMADCPYPIIFCGDFNDTPVSYAYNVFNELLTDVFRSRGRGIGNTYIGNFPSFRIDYIFTSPEFGHTHFKVLPEELSDHRAIWGEVSY